jgi:tRNA(Ile)-lysidine synthase
MPASLPNRVLRFIRRNALLRAGQRVAAGVSGGADSVALFLLLGELREELGIALLVAHFNHRLRGDAADADEQFVADLAARHGVEFIARRCDVRAVAAEHGWNLEDAGRRLRYSFFEELVSNHQADRVAVGHTADDQAESVLAHVLRGTGHTGLRGIHVRRGAVVRPLLEIRRAELREYVRARGQAWREDESNLDDTRLRARIRRRLVPLLEGEFQPRVVEHLGTLARLAAGEEAFWDAVTEAGLAAAATRTDGGWTVRAEDLLHPRMAAVDAETFGGEAAEAMARRQVRRLAERCQGGRVQLHAEHVESVLRLARQGRSGQKLELPGGLTVVRQFERLLFSGPAGRSGRAEETAAAARSYEYPVQPAATEGETQLAIVEVNKRLRLKVFDWPRRARDTSTRSSALDCDLLRPPLVIRNWRPGDAYRPAGRRSRKKLKQLFVELRVPAEARPGWPVLESGGRVAWALNMPAAEEFAVRAATRRALEITEEQP